MVRPSVDPLPIEQGKTREQKGATEMYEPRRNAATLLDAQLRFAEMVVDACAQGAKMYWAIWGLWARRQSMPWKRWKARSIDTSSN
jgi:hypothetical protein